MLHNLLGKCIMMGFCSSFMKQMISTNELVKEFSIEKCSSQAIFFLSFRRHAFKFIPSKHLKCCTAWNVHLLSCFFFIKTFLFRRFNLCYLSFCAQTKRLQKYYCYKQFMLSLQLSSPEVLKRKYTKRRPPTCCVIMKHHVLVRHQIPIYFWTQTGIFYAWTEDGTTE